MGYKLNNKRLSLLWRTVLLLTIGVVLCHIIIYAWVQRSVNTHFEQMDSEILTHAAFNLRKRANDAVIQTASSELNEASHLHSTRLDYDLKTLIYNRNGELISSAPSSFEDDLAKDLDIRQFWQKYNDQQFTFKVNHRHYRAIIIQKDKGLALIALPIDVHHQYLLQFNHQLRLLLIGITLLLVSIAALSVYWGFAPLATFIQKMKGISSEQLDERIMVSNMPRELRPLAESYNAMMDKLESNFESLSRYSDNIAHELRTPLATLSTQTQVMLSQPRQVGEYIEQLHQQHETIEQLSLLINNMLLLAKTQKGLSRTQLRPIDTSKMISKLLSYYEFIAEEQDISFETKGDFAAVLGDESLLQRMFANLIANAVYYASEGSKVTIDADVQSSGSHNKKVVISFTNRLDEPMSKQDVDKLFTRFHRHHPEKNSHIGTGLGLSIVQAIVKAHKGNVQLRVIDNYYFQVKVELLRSGY